MKKWTIITIPMLILLFNSISLAKPQTKKELQPVLKYFACLQGKPCQLEKIMTDNALEVTKEGLPKLLKKTKIFSVHLIQQMPKQYKKRYDRILGRMLKTLKEAKYDITQVHKLGRGQSLAVIAPNVALAFVAISFLRENKTVKTDYFYITLWKVKTRWLIAYMDDFPAKWMTNHRPNNIEKK